jgi:hypothetical protein
MKKIYFILAIIVMVINVNAQWFIGGNLGFKVNVSGSRENEKLIPYQSQIGFTIAPKFGYFFNDKIALGIDLAVGPTFTEEAQTYAYYDNWGYPHVTTISFQGTYIHWRFAPFLRYSVFTHKKFSMLLEGSIGAAAMHVKKNYVMPLSMPEEKFSNIGVGILNILPVLSYKLNDHILLEAQLNFLNIGYNMDLLVRDSETVIIHDFNIGFNARSVFVVSQLTIGAIYKF